MKYKDGVIVNLTKVEGGKFIQFMPSNYIIGAMKKADEVSIRLTNKEIVVTSLLDGVHSKNSLHYVGNAFDMRIWIYTQKQIAEIDKRLKKELGKDYDVVLEKDHFHVEYDPKS